MTPDHGAPTIRVLTVGNLSESRAAPTIRVLTVVGR